MQQKLTEIAKNISVGHRSTLNKYHQKVLRLDKTEKRVYLENL